jgi:predicted nucleic acid-binding protein
MSADFLDSNVLVYLFDETDERKRSIADTRVRRALDTHDAVISHQVVQETLNVLTRGMRSAVRPEDIREFLARTLVPLWKGSPSPALYESALSLRDRYGFGFYDALIVAAAIEAGCTRLLTEDLQHGQRIEGLTIENPFR